MSDELLFFIVWGQYGEDILGIYRSRAKAIERCRDEWKTYTGSLDVSQFAWVTENTFDDNGQHAGRAIAFTMDKP